MTSAFLTCGIGVLPFKFLGVMVGGNPMRVGMWKYVVEDVRRRLNKWRGRYLSIGGTVTLINYVLNAIPLYYLSFYHAPKKVLNEISCIQRRFLWGGLDGGRRINWVSWHNMCIPKEDGGLGIREVVHMNVALLMKLKWSILKEDNSPWSSLIKYRYGKPKIKMFVNDKSVIAKGDLMWWCDLIMINDCVESNGIFVSDLFNCRIQMEKVLLSGSASGWGVSLYRRRIWSSTRRRFTP